jgi:dipeptidase D
LDVKIFDGANELLGVSAHGMKGGHSGVDIAKHRANANKVMARLLSAGISVAPMRLVELKGGTGRNVIPRACEAIVACRRDRIDELVKALASLARIIEQEYRTADPGLTIHIEKKGPAAADGRGVTESDTAMVVNLLTALPCGPAEMAEDFPLLVQTSTNLSMVEISKDALAVTSSQRSSVPSRLDAMCLAVESVGRLAGAMVHTGSGYPSWPMNRESPLLKRCTSLYRELFGAAPTVQVMHAGLECGVIGDRCPDMDMISLGPTMENPHSPSERLYLPSVEKVWRLMVALLKALGR